MLVLAVTATGAPIAWGADDPHADVCLEVVTEALPGEAWVDVVEAVADVIGDRTALFLAPVIEATPAAGVDLDAYTSARLDIHSGHQGGTLPGTSAACLLPGVQWSARFGRAFLEAAGRHMLEKAPTTPGIASELTIEWHPEERRVRTLLTFAGPLDIPNGRCWVDDVLTIDAAAGVAVASGEQGMETSLFAEAACSRFFSYLPDGGAGEQAVGLLPSEILLPDGGSVRLVATEVSVQDEAIVVGGVLESY